MALGIRGANPIWAEVNLVGKLFDDTYYLYVLENTIPYIPAVVYHDPDLNTPWTSPIQFLGNGTLPIDIYFETDKVYRLEFRQNNGINPPSQSDALIYEVNNYIAGTGGSTPVDTVAFASSNQITNPQFSLISFSSPFTLSGTDPASIEVGPGWFLDLAGTGTVTLTRVPLNNANANPSNAPYALELTLNGWSSAELRQRFQQNGMLWANKIVSSTITARIQGAPQNISAGLVDSNGTPLTTVLASTVVNDDFNEFTGYGELGDTTNPNTPPVAYIDYRLSLPVNVDIYVTSIQLVVQELPIEPSFEQDSIERQVDHTWHYYRDSVLFQPKSTILTGWNFALNPWQFLTTASTNIAASKYTADQTIVSLQTPTSLESQRTTEGYFGIQSVAAAAQGKFAIIQYVDALSIAPYWGSIVSSLVKMGISTTHATALQFKMRVLYRASAPVAVDPIASWAATDPTFTAGWTALTPKDDPVVTVSSAALANFPFEGIQLPVPFSSTAMIAIVLYTTNTLNSAATADKVYFDKISLVPNSFAIDTQPQTYDQVLRECFLYYEKSYAQNVLPGTINAGGALFAPQLASNSGGNNLVTLKSFGFTFKNIKRSTAPVIQTYSPTSGTASALRVFLRNNGASVTDADVTLGDWTQAFLSSPGVSYNANTIAAQLTTAGANNSPEGYVLYHYTVDARLGLVA